MRDPDTGRRQLDGRGDNPKNRYPHRATPRDPDFLRKLATDTPHEALVRWYGSEVARFLHGLGAFEDEGIFPVDGTELFVPDDKHHEPSARLRFDEHDHLLAKQGYEKLTEREKTRQETLAAKKTEEERAEAEEGVQRIEMKPLRSTGLRDELRIPLRVVPMRARRPDGKVTEWCLATTREPSGPVEVYESDRRRVDVEEKIRQTKCFRDMSRFPSRAFSLARRQ